MLLCVTASHKTAPFDLLERLSTHAAPVAPLIAGREQVQGAVVLSTCNRVEAYVEVPDGAEVQGVEAALHALHTATGVSPSELEGAYEVKAGGRVAEHLFSVASGLESVVIGEGEIAGQVRRALDDARSFDATSPELERLFQRATETQKGVKNATALGRAGRSLVRLALELADSRIADWSGLRTLLVGTGAYAAATLAALRDHGVTDITVHSPSGRGARFAAKHEIAFVEAAGFAEAAARADLVITCTSNEEPVVTPELLRRGGYRGRGFVIDLGLPRNVSAEVAELEGMTLLDLETIRLHAPLEELRAHDDARRMVRDAAAKFHLVGREQSAAPAIVALREHVFELLDAEIGRGKGRGDDERIEQALRHMVGRLLHTPTARARELAAQGRADDVFEALETLFGIDARPAADHGEPDAATCPYRGEATA
ncbi:glutamyl-tRNA reductase [Microbacterium sp. Marseille-Q6965]|uniref:glutamyl-tRNA reductase n=1 Tax=Microbacterium sp. Marseille-Q6965 TaxID=2965072 RepID=UPI0021B7C5F9|nr:glutamyl-tRNA reductase [Microbacterium sp. Marseille-Q6965]